MVLKQKSRGKAVTIADPILAPVGALQRDETFLELDAAIGVGLGREQ
jgi:hypothetical protein